MPNTPNPGVLNSINSRSVPRPRSSGLITVSQRARLIDQVISKSRRSKAWPPTSSSIRLLQGIAYAGSEQRQGRIAVFLHRLARGQAEQFALRLEHLIADLELIVRIDHR